MASLRRRPTVLPRWASEKPDASRDVPVTGAARIARSTSSPGLQMLSRRASLTPSRGSQLPSVARGRETPPTTPSTSYPGLDTPPASAPAKKDAGAKLPSVDLTTQAFTLSRKHRLDLHEVNYALKKIQETPHNLPNGGMERNAFETMLMKLFEVRHLEDDVVLGAYRESKAADGPLDVDRFLVWYRDNMFTAVAALTADREMQQTADMVSSLAKKHGISVCDLDVIKKKFDEFDTDKSGEIEYDEFEAMMGKLLGLKIAGQIPYQRMQKFWREIDLDGGGSVDFSEFTAWYLKYFGDNGAGGPLESFYASFNPDVQRSKGLENAGGVSEDDPAESKSSIDTAALHPSLALIDEGHRKSLLALETRRRTTIE